MVYFIDPILHLSINLSTYLFIYLSIYLNIIKYKKTIYIYINIYIERTVGFAKLFEGGYHGK